MSKKKSVRYFDRVLTDAEIREVKPEDHEEEESEIPKAKIKKYSRGENISKKAMRTKASQKKVALYNKKLSHAVRQSALCENLWLEQPGFVEADDNEETHQISQNEISEQSDLLTQQKRFHLTLDKFGPYRLNYTRNGRQLVIGGRKGHVAAFDWQTKKLMCEMNVMETVNDVRWLHTENMFAVAQKRWVYIYDNQGIELHCLKSLDAVRKLDFLPYHFLLVSGNDRGYLSYIDVSVGEKIAGFQTHLGPLDLMCHNPSNAIVHLAHPSGQVSLWSPNSNEPLVKMLCHRCAIRSIAIDQTGNYLATSAVDRLLKIWDLRTYRQLSSIHLMNGASNMSFSQTGLLATAINNCVQIYREPSNANEDASPVLPYLQHKVKTPVSGLQFCPFEDVLGVASNFGFDSMLVPGSGEPNFDALEANPYQSKKQRQQAEVKMLLQKIPSQLIALDSEELGEVDRKTAVEQFEAKKEILYVKPQKVDLSLRKKRKKHKPDRKKLLEEERRWKEVVQLKKQSKKPHS